MVPAMESSIQGAPQVCVVFPAYNEKATVARSLAAALAQPCVAEVVAVDDGSTDGTLEILLSLAATEPRLRVFRHGKNQGKGAAVRTGIQHATAPVVLVQDADLEYDPAEYPALIAPILAGKADAVFGSRFIGSGAHRVLYFWHAAGNRFLTLLSNMATNLNLTDMEACYKAFRRELIQSVEIEEDRFGFEPEIVAKVARAGARIYEVAISYHGRTYAEGKKIGWKDGVSALRCILKYGVLRRGKPAGYIAPGNAQPRSDANAGSPIT
jgi:glycosyltransferase involved in cell wall biosynthesis